MEHQYLLKVLITNILTYRHIKHSNIIDFIFSEVPTWAQKNYLSTVFSGAISSLKLRFKILGLLTRPTQ